MGQLETQKLVGFKINGAKLLARDVTADFKILDEKIRIHVILAHALRPDEKPEVKKFYYNLMEQVEDYEIPTEELAGC